MNRNHDESSKLLGGAIKNCGYDERAIRPAESHASPEREAQLNKDDVDNEEVPGAPKDDRLEYGEFDSFLSRKIMQSIQ